MGGEFGLENPMDGGARWATVHGVAESDVTCTTMVGAGPSNEHPGLISFRMDWLDLPTREESGVLRFPSRQGLTPRVQPNVYRIFQARILEWVAISFSRGSSQSR